MDFYQIETEQDKKNGGLAVYADFVVGEFKDLMIRGGQFYAVWDEEKGLWSTNRLDVPPLVDKDLQKFADAATAKSGTKHTVKKLSSHGSAQWDKFMRYANGIGYSTHQLDEHLTFADTPVKKSDYVSRRLPYSLEPNGDHSAWDELIGTLYPIDERAKIEWAIGAIVAGDAKKIQKFLVLYGPAATGKSTILNIIEKLFVGYTTTFDAKALGNGNNNFAGSVFKNNPLVAIQHDGDLSRIADNTKLNSIIAHEDMTMEEKYKDIYTARVNAFLFMGTNQPVKISDAKSGIIRRLIDVHPTGVRISPKHYQALLAKIDFELGAIAAHCLEVYHSMGKNYYNSYRPLEMMLQTDVFFNYIEAYYDVFKKQDGATLNQAYILYKEYCTDSGIEKMLPKYKFRDEFRNYFDEFQNRAVIDGETVSSYYSGFNANKFKAPSRKDMIYSLVMDETQSLFDEVFINQPAQYATARETPKNKWEDVETRLGEIDTTEVHFVLVPENHIVIDFDLKDENGSKSLERNLEAASVWPPTYAEISKGGAGVHLHYTYDGAVEELSNVFSEGIEVKVFLGFASLRRRLTKCNNVPVATLRSGLPLKEKKVLHSETVHSEKVLRDLISRNMRKEIHPGTKPSIDFIKHILDEAYESGLEYDVSDLHSKLIAFANNSTNQPLICLKIVQQMKFKSQEEVAAVEPITDPRLALFDVEVFPNLFVICWKYEDDPNVVRMLNPTAQEVEKLFALKLVGFNNRRYDNHILYARVLGYDNESLFKLSQRLIVENDRGAYFGAAYNISYADIWDFSSKKQGLKKFQIDLGIPHKELNFPWDEPVAEADIPKVVEYCVNDVVSEEAVLKDRAQDFIARQILADLSGLTVNDTTQKHTARIIFGEDRNPQTEFVYTDLSKEFPGYVFTMGKSTYGDELPGEGGYVYAEPGIYHNVAVLDVASMHPTSIEQLNLFGRYTKNFSALKSARMAIKHKDYKAARSMLDGKLAKYLERDEDSEALSYALKIVINIVYGLTSAKFDNPFRDIRNVDNIVAKRGALFMIDLKREVQARGFTVAHIKTDSIKIPNATPEIIEFITMFGEKYGYDFEHEATYDRFCLVNDAVFVARVEDDCGTYTWKAVGAQFQHPYVFKTLFSHDPIIFDDMCETKEVNKGAMYLHFEHDKPTAEVEDMRFVGKTGRFVPVVEGRGGGILYRINEDKKYAVSGTKGYLWMEAEVARGLEEGDWINVHYFENMVDEAIKTIEKFGDFKEFTSQE